MYYLYIQVVLYGKVVLMKRFTSSVSPKGQITLPVEIRRQLGVQPKDKVVITFDQGEVKVTLAQSTLAASYQAVPALT